MSFKDWTWPMCLVLLTLALALMGLGVGSLGWQAPWHDTGDAITQRIVWDIRAPRTLGAGLVGALLGLAGALAQGLFRNPLAEPYLLGSSSGAAMCMTLALTWGLPWMVAEGWWARVGLTGAAFVGALAGVALTLTLARGATQTMRLLLSGVVVGVVLGAFTQLMMLWSGEAWRVMQAFMLGNTSLLGWPACALLAVALGVTAPVAAAMAPALDALSLGEDTARMLGVPLAAVRWVLVSAMALATAAAVSQAGLVAFVGLAAPHLVRPWSGARHVRLLWASALMGAALLMAADLGARVLMAPQELPVGVLTAVLGGAYLLLILHRRPA